MVAQPNQNLEYIKKAVEAAQQEKGKLSEKLGELRKIEERLSQLEMFIEQGKLLIGIGSVEDSSQPIRQITIRRKGLGLLPRDDSEKPLFLKVVQIIKEAGRPLGLKEMVEEFRKRKWKLSENNPREVLRNTLKLKPHIFSKKEEENGKQVLYGLKDEASE